jgi:hypothetical protein
MPGANPRALSRTLVNPLARMLPGIGTGRFQTQVYRLGEKNPPGMQGYAPHWAITQLSLTPMASTQVRMNLQPNFHWLATLASTLPAAVPTATTAPLVVATPTLPVGVVGVPYNTTVLVTGGTPPYTAILAAGSTLPAGLSISPTPNNNGFVISGTPTTATTTPQSFQVDITDSAATPATLTATLAITVAATQSAVPFVSTYRAQTYDTRKALRMADRGVRHANLGGTGSAASWMRDPYVFDVPDPQVLLVVQNLKNAQNEIQIVHYGQVLRFNQLPGTW